MRKLAMMTIGAVLAVSAANAQTSGTPGAAGAGTETRGVNRTGQADRGAADMQTGSSTIPGTQTDTTSRQGEQENVAQTVPSQVEPAEPYGSQQPGTPQSAAPAQQPSTAEQEEQGEAQRSSEPMEQSQPPAGSQVQPAQPGQQAQPSESGAPVLDPFAEIQPADLGQQGGTAYRSLPAASGNWLAMLLGGGLLSAAGLGLRRRRR